MSRAPDRARQRTRLDPEARRASLLDAAERAFAERGVEGARVEDVAAEAGVAVGLLYRYFSSKDELLDALMQRRGEAFYDRLRARLDDLDGGDSPPATLVIEGLRVWLDQVVSDVASGRWVTSSEPAPCARFRHETREFVISQIRAVVPTVDPALAAIVTAMVEAAAENATYAWAETGHAVDRETLVQLVTEYTLGGMDRLARLLGLDVAFSS